LCITIAIAITIFIINIIIIITTAINTITIITYSPYCVPVSSGADFSTCIENIDIGGPSMLRSSAKNHSYVTIVTSPTQYSGLLEQLKLNGGATTLQLRRQFAAQAFATSAVRTGI